MRFVQVGAVLHHIETGNLLPPLVVLAILAKNPTLQLRVVKDYIARQLSAESAHIQEDRAQIAKYQQETAQMRAEVKELRTQVSMQSATALKQVHSAVHMAMHTTQCVVRHNIQPYEVYFICMLMTHDIPSMLKFATCKTSLGASCALPFKTKLYI